MSNVGGGSCDCGDAEAWRNPLSCPQHSEESAKKSLLDAELMEITQSLVDVLMRWCVSVLKKSYTTATVMERLCCVLWNDEVHSFPEVIDVVRSAIRCDENRARAIAEEVDSIGRSIIYSSPNLEECERVQRIINSIGLELKIDSLLKCIKEDRSFDIIDWLINSSKDSAYLQEALKNVLMSLYDEGEYFFDVLLACDHFLWKKLRLQLKEMYVALLLTENEPKIFASERFALMYEKIANNFMKESREPQLSVIFFSVQIFTTPSIAKKLVDEGFLNRLFSFIKSSLDKHLSNGVINVHDPQLRQSTYFHLFQDVKFLLESCHNYNAQQDGHLLECLDEFLLLLQPFQGMNKQKRESNEHVLFENDKWITSFNLECHVALLTRLFAANFASSESLLKAIKIVLKFVEASLQTVGFDDFEVAKSEISFHFPIFRFLSYLLRRLSKFGIGLDVIMEHKDIFKKLIYYPLTLQVLASQTRLNWWVRNGYSIKNQILNYFSTSLREDYYDPDFFLLQACVIALDESDLYCIICRQFMIYAMKSEVSEGEQLSTMLQFSQDMIELIISLYSERRWLDLCEDNRERIGKIEVIHALSTGPCTFSDLKKKIVDSIFDSVDIDKILAELALYKPPTTNSAGLFELKPQFVPLIDRYFFRLGRKERSLLSEKLPLQRYKESLPRLFGVNANLEKLVECFIPVVTTSLYKLSKSLQTEFNEGLADVCTEFISRFKLNCLGYLPEITAETIQIRKDLECFENVSLVEVVKICIQDVKFKSFKKDLQESMFMWSNDGIFSPKRSIQLDEEDEEEKKKKIAKERQERLLKQMNQAQNAFMDFNSQELEESTAAEEEMVCVICKEKKDEFMGIFSHIRVSHFIRVLEKPMKEEECYGMSKLNTSIGWLNMKGSFVSSCGHCIHQSCFESYAAARTPALFCPLCKMFGNCIIPIYADSEWKRNCLEKQADCSELLKLIENVLQDEVIVPATEEPFETLEQLTAILFGPSGNAVNLTSSKRIMGTIAYTIKVLCNLSSVRTSVADSLSLIFWSQAKFYSKLRTMELSSMMKGIMSYTNDDPFYLMVVCLSFFPMTPSIDMKLIFLLIKVMQLSSFNDSTDVIAHLLGLNFTPLSSIYMTEALEKLKIQLIPFLEQSEFFINKILSCNANEEEFDLNLDEALQFDNKCDLLLWKIGFKPPLKKILESVQGSLPLAFATKYFSKLKNDDSLKCSMIEYPYCYDLFKLPSLFNSLLDMIAVEKCTKCSKIPSTPAICMLCSRILCSQSYCCTTNDRGECYSHFTKCGKNVGIFFLPFKNVFLLFSKEAGAFIMSPYLDSHGETDYGLKKGNEQYLHLDRIAEMRRMWIEHEISSVVAKKFDTLMDFQGWMSL